MISTKLLRNLGFQKITANEFDVELFTRLNNQLYDTDIKAWSVLDIAYDTNFETEYDGFDRLISEALNGYEIDHPRRRVFKNTWNMIWKTYGEATSYPDALIAVLHSLGLKLAFYMSNDADIVKAREFFNDIVNWYIYSRRKDIDDVNVVTHLVLGDIDDLRELMKGE